LTKTAKSRALLLRGSGAAMKRSVWAVCLLLLAGCGTPKPNFLAVIQRNCDQGNAEACEMLASVSSAANEDVDIAPPLYSHDIAQAIFAGMQRAKQNNIVRYLQAPAPIVENPEDD